MSNHNALQLAIEVAQRQRDLAQRHLHDRRQEVRAAQDQLQQLQAYEQQSQYRLVHQGAAWQSMEMARHHYQFMERLAHAIGLQTQAVARAIRMEDDMHKRLIQAQTRVKALQLVLDQRLQQVTSEKNRREQRAMDEMALHAYMRHRQANATGETQWQ